MAVPGSEVSASQIRTAMAGPSSTAATPLGALYRDNDAGTPGTALQPPNIRRNVPIPDEETGGQISFTQFRSTSGVETLSKPLTTQSPNPTPAHNTWTGSPHGNVQSTGKYQGSAPTSPASGVHTTVPVETVYSIEASKEVTRINSLTSPAMPGETGGAINLNTPASGTPTAPGSDVNSSQHPSFGSVQTSGVYKTRIRDGATSLVRNANAPYGHHVYTDHPHSHPHHHVHPHHHIHPHHHSSGPRYYNYQAYNPNVGHHNHWHGHGHANAHFNHGHSATGGFRHAHWAHFPSCISCSVIHWHYDPHVLGVTNHGNSHVPHHHNPGGHHHTPGGHHHTPGGHSPGGHGHANYRRQAAAMTEAVVTVSYDADKE